MTPRPRFRSDLAIGLAFAAAGLGIWFEAGGLRRMPGMIVGSGLFPQITAAGMILFGTVLAAGALLGLRRARAGPARPAAGAAAGPPAQPGRPLSLSAYSVAVLAAIVLLAAALPSAGFLLGGLGFAAVVARLGGARWTGSLLVAAVLVGGLYWAFVHGLRVPLPVGPFGV